MRNHCGVTGALGHFDGGEGFCQRADLVDLDQDRVGDTLLDAFTQNLGVGDEQIVADQLNLLAQRCGQGGPAFPVVFRHGVFDGDDRVLVAPGCQQVGEVGGRQRQAFGFQLVFAVFVEFAGGAVEAQGDLGAWLVAGLLDCLDDQLDRFFVIGDRWGKAAFVAN